MESSKYRGAGPTCIRKFTVAFFTMIINGSFVLGFLGGNRESFYSTSFSQHSCSIQPSSRQLAITARRDFGVFILNDSECYYNPREDDNHGRQRSNTVGHDYTLEANSNPNIIEDCRFTEKQIHVLISKRLEFKKARNFVDADRILKGLNMNGIFLQDKQRKYRVDGENHFGRKTRYVQRGSSHGVLPEDIELISDMVEERARYKRMREYHVSDQITEKLKRDFGVKVNDKKREWSIVVDSSSSEGSGKESTDHYVPTPLAAPDHPTHTMDAEDKKIIQERLVDRSEARRNKQYQEADRIRDELVEKYSIVIDDRTKEWKIVSKYIDGDDDPFIVEAQMSQRSAFARQQKDRRNYDEIEDKGSSESVLPDTADTHKHEAQKDDNETMESLKMLTVISLKEKLREVGLPVSGNKAELIDRLLTSSMK